MKLLIATDGSDHSTAAIEECCRFLIHPENADVLIVSAYEDANPIAAEPFALSVEYYQKLEEALREQSGSFVEAARKIIRDKFPNSTFPLETEVLRGPADQQIVERAAEWKADIIAVGSHGRGFWGRLLGSVSNGVVHHAPCPVFVVRKPNP